MENKPNADVKREMQKIMEEAMRPSIRVNRTGVFVLMWLTIMMLVSMCFYPSPPIYNYDINYFIRWRSEYYAGIAIINIMWAIGMLKFEFYRIYMVGYIKLIAFWITYLFWLLMLFMGPQYFKFLENWSLTPLAIPIIVAPIMFVILCFLGRLIFTED